MPIHGIKKGFKPQLFEIGKIKIGMKGDETTTKSGAKMKRPTKLDHFLIVQNKRDSSDNYIQHPIMKSLSPNPTEIKIKLLFDSPTQNLFTQYRYQAKVKTTAGDRNQIVCTGDGENALRFNPKTGKEEPIPCNPETCPLFYKNKDDHAGCKWFGVLSCLLEDVDVVGGCFKYRTTSEIAINSIMNSMLVVAYITHGILADVPLKLTLHPVMVHPKHLPNPVQAHVVNLEYEGSREQLSELGRAIYNKRIEEAKQWQALGVEKPKLLIEGEVNFETLDDQEDIRAEFYHDSVIEEEKIKIPEKPEKPTGEWKSEWDTGFSLFKKKPKKNLLA